MAELQRTSRGGRPPGSKDLHTLMGRERIKRYSVEAVEFMYAVLHDRVPCNVCDGTGKQPIEGQPGKFHDRKCSSCKGRRRDRLRPELRFAAACEICDRGGVPKEKQVDHVSTDGSQVTGIRMILVQAQPQVEGASGVQIPPQLMKPED